MRVVSWNLAYWKPASFKTIHNRWRQWAQLAALAPDIAVLQECRPSDLTECAPSWFADEYSIVGAIPGGWTACSAIVAKRTLRLEPVDLATFPTDERRWLEYLSGYLALGRCTLGASSLFVASVHATAKAIDDIAITSDDHAAVRRSKVAEAWNCDLAAAALQPATADGPFIIGGDWNTARKFDETYPGQVARSREGVLRASSRAGLARVASEVPS